MKTRLALLGCAALLSLLLGAVVSGREGVGRVALSFGFPDLASAVTPGGQWRAAAHYRAGDYAAAITEFGDDARGLFNRSNAYAHLGDYAEALTGYEAAQAQAPGLVDAKINHAIVAELYAGTKFQAPLIPLERVEREENVMAALPGQGGARAQGTGSEANNPGSSFKMHDLLASGLRRVPRMFDDKYIEASERWLQSLEDQPGQYLKARIDAERKQRARQAERTE